jgi:hypothetical protein
MYNPQIIWYKKQDVLNIYPISERTYFRKIKSLNGKIRTKDYRNTKGKKSILIHRDDLQSVFELKRTPINIECKSIMRKYIGTLKWDFIGNIIPESNNISDLKNKMKFIFDQLKSLDKQVSFFYSIEKNTKDSFYHSHFLIRTKIKKNEISELLSLICEENTKHYTRIHLKQYDYQNFHFKGSFYSLKTEEQDKGENSVYNEMMR